MSKADKKPMGMVEAMKAAQKAAWSSMGIDIEPAPLRDDDPPPPTYWHCDMQISKEEFDVALISAGAYVTTVNGDEIKLHILDTFYRLNGN